MVDIFLMGTAGDSGWREPIKAACNRMGLTYYDPLVPEWNEEAKRRETEALQGAHVLVMAITKETASVASLAESGWAALSALKRQQAFGLYIAPEYEGDEPSGSSGGLSAWLMETFFSGRDRAQGDTMETASERARRLVLSHANRLVQEFPELNFFVASDLAALQNWAIRMAHQMAGKT